MDLSSINTSRMAGMGDYAPPEKYAPYTREDRIEQMADIILAECETVEGAVAFSTEWASCNGAPPGLPALVMVVESLRGMNLREMDIRREIGSVVINTIRAEAMRQAKERVQS